MSAWIKVLLLAMTSSLGLAAGATALSGGDGLTKSAKVSSAERRSLQPATDQRSDVAFDHRAQARIFATERSSSIPLPVGGNFNGVQWEQFDGPVPLPVLDGILEYNAACQWLRAAADGRETETARAVLPAVSEWPSLRGTESATSVKRAAAELSANSPSSGSGVLRDCREIHGREVLYATTQGLRPTT